MSDSPYELGRTAYEESIRGYEDRLPWRQLSAWAQAHWARIELASRKAEVRDREQRWEQVQRDAKAGLTSPAKVFGK